jgi:hypothetical protein
MSLEDIKKRWEQMFVDYGPQAFCDKDRREIRALINVADAAKECWQTPGFTFSDKVGQEAVNKLIEALADLERE